MYTYIYIERERGYVYMCVYIYIFIERENIERERCIYIYIYTHMLLCII